MYMVFVILVRYSSKYSELFIARGRNLILEKDYFIQKTCLVVCQNLLSWNTTQSVYSYRIVFFLEKLGKKDFCFIFGNQFSSRLFLLKRFLCPDSTMMAFLFRHEIFSFLTLSRRRPLPYRNQSIDNGLRLERVNGTYILNKFGKVSLKIFKPYNSLLSLSKSKFIKSV